MLRQCSSLVVLLAIVLVGRNVCSPHVAVAKDPPKKQQTKQRKPTWRGGGQMIPDVARDKVICFALYTIEDSTLKLSAQFYPLNKDESREAQLQIQADGKWKTVATSPIDDKGWLATFRIEDWDHSRNAQYRVAHAGGATYAGLVRKDPVDKDEIVVAAFTGNSNSDRGPRADIVANIKAQDPDLLFFSGDQSYDHKHHTAAWLLFGRQFGEIIKDRPTVTIPDDHDVGQPNLWGENGKVSHLSGAADGGYIMTADYVNMVQRAQTSHLPDPYDPTPIKQDISVYYTSLNVGGVDFAIIEDRKFKTGPAGLIPKQGPRPDHINSPGYDPQAVDVPEARLLGDRQIQFLNTWGQTWENVQMKAVLSQTIFAGGAHIHGRTMDRLIADLDSNGWPQSGRARALKEMRRCFAFHIAGDQHLATVIHHGINSWEDSGYSFCVPSIVNFYGRWWHPLEAPLDHNEANPLPYTGRYFDGFKNKLTMHAYANPTDENHKAAGYGLVRFKKSSQQITMECWPRQVDATNAQVRQHPGWPITINQSDNYARDAIAWLPSLKINGLDRPLVQVIDELTGEIVYTVRVPSSTWQPKVFREGSYTIHIGSGESKQTFARVQATPMAKSTVIEADF